MKRFFFYTSLGLLTFFFLNCLINISTSAQKLEQIQSFDIGTPFLEPDGRREVLKLNDDTFIVATKTKGSMVGDAECVLEKIDQNLKPIYKTTFKLRDTEELKEMYYANGEIVLLMVIHDTELSKSVLAANIYDARTGTFKSHKVLVETSINKWHEDKLKGAVKLSFENYVGTLIGQNFITPPEYQYEIQFSPDSSKMLTYIFDYSQKKLIAKAQIFDKNLNKISEGIIPVDNHFVNYGLFLNDAGEIVILNGDKQGRIVVVEYDIITHSNKFLDIQYASAHRESLKIQILNNDIIYVANIVTDKGGKLLAVMYSKFNFKINKVEKVKYHNITDSLKLVVQGIRTTAKMHGEENWHNYELTNFNIDASEKVTVVLEKREIQSPGFTYNHASVLDMNKLVEGAGRINAESILIMCFDKQDALLFENYCPKVQNADITSGLNSASYSMDISTTGKLRLLYTTAENSTGVFNTLNYFEWDENTGTMTKNLKLENPEGLGLLRNYTLWYADKLILCGKKGLMGKKSFISSYLLK